MRLQARDELESLDAVARDLTAFGSARRMVDGFVAIEKDQQMAEERRKRAEQAKQEAALHRSSSSESLIGDTSDEDARMKEQREQVRCRGVHWHAVRAGRRFVEKCTSLYQLAPVRGNGIHADCRRNGLPL